MFEKIFFLEKSPVQPLVLTLTLKEGKNTYIPKSCMLTKPHSCWGWWAWRLYSRLRRAGTCKQSWMRIILPLSDMIANPVPRMRANELLPMSTWHPETGR